MLLVKWLAHSIKSLFFVRLRKKKKKKTSHPQKSLTFCKDYSTMLNFKLRTTWSALGLEVLIWTISGKRLCAKYLKEYRLVMSPKYNVLVQMQFTKGLVVKGWSYEDWCITLRWIDMLKWRKPLTLKKKPDIIFLCVLR